MRASVHARQPGLAADEARLTALAAEHGLQVRGTHGEHSQSEGAVYDVSNKWRLEITEVEAVRGLANGAAALIAAEQRT